MSFACVSVETRSVLVSRATRRLNERGSVRKETTRSPPDNAAAVRAGGVGLGPEGHAARPAAATKTMEAPTMRDSLVKSCLEGQKAGRSTLRAVWAHKVILHAK